MIHIPDIDILSPEIIKEIKSLLFSDIKSLIALPVISAYKTIGFLGLETINEKESGQKTLFLL